MSGRRPNRPKSQEEQDQSSSLLQPNTPMPGNKPKDDLSDTDTLSVKTKDDVRSTDQAGQTWIDRSSNTVNTNVDQIDEDALQPILESLDLQGTEVLTSYYAPETGRLLTVAQAIAFVENKIARLKDAAIDTIILDSATQDALDGFSYEYVLDRTKLPPRKKATKVQASNGAEIAEVPEQPPLPAGARNMAARPMRKPAAQSAAAAPPQTRTQAPPKIPSQPPPPDQPAGDSLRQEVLEGSIDGKMILGYEMKGMIFGKSGNLFVFLDSKGTKTTTSRAKLRLVARTHGTEIQIRVVMDDMRDEEFPYEFQTAQGVGEQDEEDSKDLQPTVRVNWKAFRSIKISGRGDSKWPRDVQEYYAQSTEAIGVQPLHVALDFDPDQVIADSVFVGAPTAIKEFVDMIKQGHVEIILKAQACGTEFLKRTVARFEMEATNNPLSIFNTSVRPKFTPDCMIVKPYSDDIMKTYAYPARYGGFFGFEEYSIVMSMASRMDYLVNRRKLNQFYAKKVLVRLVNIPRAEDRAYVGWIYLDEHAPMLRANAKLQIGIDGPSDDKNAWTGYVTEDPSLHLEDHATFYMVRPWSTNNKVTKSANRRASVPAVHPVSLGNDWSNKLTMSKGRKYEITLEDTDKSHDQNLQGLELMSNSPVNNPPTEYNRRIKEVLPLQRVDKMKFYDMFESVRPGMHKYLQHMRFNKEQQAGFVAAEKVRMKIQVHNGPPGTGKTHGAVEYSVPFIMEGRQVQVMSASNIAVTSLAQVWDARIAELQKEGIALDAYVVRAYSKATEESIHTSAAHVDNGGLARSLPSILSEADPEVDVVARLAAAGENIDSAENIAMSALEQGILRMVKRRVAPKFAGVADPRVEDLGLSVGVRMLQMTGIVWHQRLSKPEKYKEFRHLYSQLSSKNKILDEGQWSTYRAQAAEIYAEVMRSATVVVSTTSNAGAGSVLAHVIDHTELIIIDEASREREDNLLGIFAARYQLNPAILLSGDFMQLRPSAFQDTVFRRQLLISLPLRMAKNGWEVVHLREQHRMTPDIADLANDLTYHGSLQNADSTNVNRRPMAKLFRADMKPLNQGSTSTNIIGYAIIENAPNTTTVDRNRSRYNDAMVIVGMNAAFDLLKRHPDATVAYLTGYRAQQVRVQFARSEATRQGHGEMMERFYVLTVDAAQGREFTFAIVDILIGGGWGFLRDNRRATVALTRVRDGMILLYDKQAFENARFRSFHPGSEKRKPHYQRAIEKLRKRIYEVNVGEPGFGCDFYNERVVNIRNLIR